MLLNNKHIYNTTSHEVGRPQGVDTGLTCGWRNASLHLWAIYKPATTA